MRIPRHLNLWMISTSLIMTFNTYADADTLNNLLKKVETEHLNIEKVNSARETEFFAKKEEHANLLRQAKKNLEAERAIANELRATFDKQEKELVALEEKMNLTMGTIGELYSVVRQVAADSFASFENSITSLEHKERLDFLRKLADKKSHASIAQLKQLWFEVLTEMNESGKTVIFKSPVLAPNGETLEVNVARVGTFNLATKDAFLDYSPVTGQAVILSRQPSSSALKGNAQLHKGSDELVDFTFDPTRGNLLAKLVNAPSLKERLQQGGVVGYVILAVLFVGLVIVGERSYRIYKMNRMIKAQLNSKEIIPQNPLGDIFAISSSTKSLDIDSLEIKLHESILKTISPIDKGISTIKILAAIAPLLGLLGTVTGMIGTFQSITLFGTGDPKLMAGGISEALVTTVLGLIAAIPLILLHNYISGRSKNVTQFLEEQAAGLLVERIEGQEA